MKMIKSSLLPVLTALTCLSFQTTTITPAELVNTKWISPINDNCYESLCFTSERTVMYYRCDQNEYVEIGYSIVGDKIEIGAYGTPSMDKTSKMIFREERGVLQQVSTQVNKFPVNFIRVPQGVCN